MTRPVTSMEVLEVEILMVELLEILEVEAEVLLGSTL